MKHKEYDLQRQVCKFLDLFYSDVLYMSDTIASVKLTVQQGARNKAIQKQGFKCPDLIIFKPNSKYKGLFIELKIKNPYKKDGTLKSDEHLKGQAQTMEQLKALGYDCHFAWTLDIAREIIDNYMKN